MIDQASKYKGSKKVKLVTACFHGDNRGYSHLCDIEDVEVGDIGIARMKDGELKCLKITAVKSSDEIIPNQPFKKYAWICAIVKPEDVKLYQHIDDDVGIGVRAGGVVHNHGRVDLAAEVGRGHVEADFAHRHEDVRTRTRHVDARRVREGGRLVVGDHEMG